MIEKTLLSELLSVAMSTGGDFAEVFAQREHTTGIQFVSGKVESILDQVISGVGIRVFLGTKTYYASTSNTTRDGLLACAAAVAGAVGEGSGHAVFDLTPEAVANRHTVKHYPGDVQTREKCDLLREACLAAVEADARISQVRGAFSDSERAILVANTEGLCREDRKIRTRIAVSA